MRSSRPKLTPFCCSSARRATGRGHRLVDNTADACVDRFAKVDRNPVTQKFDDCPVDLPIGECLTHKRDQLRFVHRRFRYRKGDPEPRVELLVCEHDLFEAELLLLFEAPVFVVDVFAGPQQPIFNRRACDWLGCRDEPLGEGCRLRSDLDHSEFERLGEERLPGEDQLPPVLLWREDGVSESTAQSSCFGRRGCPARRGISAAVR